MSYLERGRPEYLRATLSLFAGAFVTFAILYTTQPILPELSKQFHVSPTEASLSVSAATGALAISMLWVSGISDIWGRKRLMSASLVASALLAIVVSFSPSLPLLIALRALQGIVLAGFPSIAMAYVNEEFHPSSAGSAMGLYVSGTSVGGMVGRMVTGALTDALSWRYAILILGFLSLSIAALFWFTLPRPRHFSPRRVSVREQFQRLREALGKPQLVGVYTLGFLLMGGFVTTYNYISYLLMGPRYHLSQTWVGMIFVVYLTGTLSSAWIGRRADKVGRGRSIQLSSTISIVGIAVTWSPNLILKILGLALFTFGFFGCHAVASGWVGRLAPHTRAQASSLYLLFYYAGSSLVGAFGGTLWVSLGWSGIIGLVMILYVAAMVLSVFITKADTADR
ncbi:MFS transporter [Alicyclobacillus ferrooxydans]|uniref:MFS transporter n=1 Tax=Alicyclobacillus ferrooxydans TaxID=471514 RepID=A0A0P9GN20_9BACL|nr:MFS transporter [Alicyclobacillus ferrooxydans]KPV41832.1 MFS transporter [Alicyclobacillus ferrooxydans]